jgi:HlyD family secretion protein
MRLIIYSCLALVLFSCKGDGSESDAYGNFTATEIIVSAENSGRILKKAVSEGVSTQEGSLAYIIDTVQTYLKKKELEARKKSVIAKKANIEAQISVLEEQEQALTKDIERFTKMLAEGAASQKQLDDLTNNLKVLQKQIRQVKTNFTSIDAEVAAIDASVRQVEDMIMRSRVKTPIQGTILETYAEEGETVAQGKPLFKVADLSTMELKAYFDSDQLIRMKIGDEVEVRVDDGDEGIRALRGTISWIASQAEFTPKIIQTREERVNLVYAVKIRVPNDGYLRINMPGEVKLLTRMEN